MKLYQAGRQGPIIGCGLTSGGREKRAVQASDKPPYLIIVCFLVFINLKAGVLFLGSGCGQGNSE